MADVLSVIQDVLNQDKHQKKEHAKMMREVQKQLKAKDEVSEEEGDKEDYMKFFAGKLKKYGVKSPSELGDEQKKKFFDEIEKDWTHDSSEEVDADLGKRVEGRMKAEQEEDEPTDDDTEEPEEEEDEDEAPVGDPDNPDTEPEEEEPSEEQIDKIADLVVQKLKDKADEEEEEEEAPEPTEAQGGKEEKIDTKPKMEAWESSANPHARYKWIEALRQVNEHCGVCGEQGIEEVRDHKGEVPEPIKPVIQTFGKKLFDYAKKSGGMDKDLFMGIAKEAMAGKLPNPKYVWNQDTDPRDFVLDSMAKEFGWMYVETKYNTTFRNRRDYVEQVELAISEALNQSKVDGRRKAFKEAIRRLIYMKMKEANRQKVKEWWNVKLREDWVDNEARKVERKWSKMSKRDKMKFVDKMEAKADRSYDYTWVEVMDALDDHGIDVSKEARKQWEEVEIDESLSLQATMALGDAGIKSEWKKDKLYVAKKDIKKAEMALSKSFKKGGEPNLYHEEVQSPHKQTDDDYELSNDWSSKDTKPAKTDKKYKKSEDKTGIGKTPKPSHSGKPVGAKGSIGQPKPDSHITKDGMMPQTEDRAPTNTPYVNDPEWGVDRDIDKDNDLPKNWSSKKAKPAKTDKKHQVTPDKTGTSKTNPSTKAVSAGKGKGGNLDAGTVKKIEGDNPNKLSVGTKSGTPNKAVGDAKKAKIVDPIGKGEKGYRKEEVSIKEKLENWGIGLKKEGYMVLPGIDRERYTEMRGLEGPFMTKSGKVVYYDSKAGMYYDRDSDIYLSYGEYMSLDRETSAQKAAMKQGPLADPKSREYKKMERDKAKAEKKAKKDALKNQYESLGVARARKFYQKEDE